MKLHLFMLVTDWIIYALLIIAVITAFYMRRRPHLSEPWRRLMRRKTAMIAMVILFFYAFIGLIDSIHFQVMRQTDNVYTYTQIESLLDIIVGPLARHDEKTYSAPFATHLYNKSIVSLPNGKEVRAYPRLRYGGAHLKDPSDRSADITLRIILGFLTGLVSYAFFACIFVWILSRCHRKKLSEYIKLIIKGKTMTAWREAMMTFAIIWVFIWIVVFLVGNYHILGTDKVGRDVFYEAIKSIRTGLLIGTLTTLFMLPFALILGMLAGYFHGWVDDIIQYLYTTLSSIPGVLLISAAILVLQVYIADHPKMFPTIIQRADARLLALCIILGITTWASLCRLLRGETLKIREQEYVQASRAFGVKRFRIIFRHVMPNVMHIVLITLVLDFSTLVLAEAVLSYVGVGVDPTTMSWGNMINSSRLQLAREPIVWWPLLAAFIFMFILVLAANLFADSVRDALDPRLRQIEEP